MRFLFEQDGLGKEAATKPLANATSLTDDFLQHTQSLSHLLSDVVVAHGNANSAWQMQWINNVTVLVVSFAFVQAITLIIWDIYFFC